MSSRHPTSPVFLTVPGQTGRLCLWHFPARNNLIEAAAAGCNAIVTLQGILEDPNIKDLLPSTCQETGMEWIQIDWWKNFFQHAGAQGHPAIIKLIDQIAERVRKGQSVLLHCAAGVHRTGMCGYGVLRRLGLTRVETLEFIKQLRITTFENCGMQRFDEMERKCKSWFGN
jgi:protein-tyrosine phosphatase